MIYQFKNSKKNIVDLLILLNDLKDSNLFITYNNERVKVNSHKTLKILLKSSYNCFYEDEGINRGIILISKSITPATESGKDDVVKHNVKFAVNTPESLNRLLIMLTWNTSKELCIKLEKNSKFLKVFKEKKFNCLWSKGNQLFLKRPKSFIKKNTQHQFYKD